MKSTKTVGYRISTTYGLLDRKEYAERGLLAILCVVLVLRYFLAQRNVVTIDYRDRFTVCLSVCLYVNVTGVNCVLRQTFTNLFTPSGRPRTWLSCKNITWQHRFNVDSNSPSFWLHLAPMNFFRDDISNGSRTIALTNKKKQTHAPTNRHY